MTETQVSCNLAGCTCGTSTTPIHARTGREIDRLLGTFADPLVTDDARTGYATENVTPITALDKANLDALIAEIPRTQHEHGPYGWRGCTSCRHLYAEAVVERFPPSRPMTR